MSRNAVHNMVPTFPQLNDWQEKALIVALRLHRAPLVESVAHLLPA